MPMGSRAAMNSSVRASYIIMANSASSIGNISTPCSKYIGSIISQSDVLSKLYFGVSFSRSRSKP